MKREAPSDTSSPTHDDLVKNLLSRPRLLGEFFRAFLPEVLEFAEIASVEYLDKEHSRSARRPRRNGDLLFKVGWRGEDRAFLIHVESQSKPHPAVLERATEYAMRDAIRYGLPVMPIILLTYPRPVTPQPSRLSWTFGKTATIEVRCPVLQFRLMDPVPYLKSANVAALALSSLMPLDSCQQVDAVVETLAESLRQHLGSEDLAAATEFVTHYTPLDGEQLLLLEKRVSKLSEQEPDLAPMPALVNPFVELGKLQGREEGLLEGLRSSILAVLELRFSGISAKVTKAVRTESDVEKLRELHRAAITAATSADFARRL